MFFVAGRRLTCAGFAPYLVTPIPGVGAFVFRTERALRVVAQGAEIVVPDSDDAEIVAASPGGTIAWATRARTIKRWSAADGVVAMRDGRFVRTWTLAVTDSGVVVAGGYEWTEAHEEHAHAEAVYMNGMPYDYGELRPSVPPQPAFEPGLAAVWSDPKPPPKTLRFAKAVTRVALDAEGDALGAWSEDGRVITSSWKERWSEGGGSVLAAALGPGGEDAAWVHPTGIYVRDTVRGVRRLVGFEPREVGAAAISLARKLVAHARPDGTIRFLSLESGTLLGTTDLHETIEALAFSGDGQSLSVVTEKAVVLGTIAANAPARADEISPTAGAARVERRPAVEPEPERESAPRSKSGPKSKSESKSIAESESDSKSDSKSPTAVEDAHLAMDPRALESLQKICGHEGLRRLVAEARDRLAAAFPSLSFAIEGSKIAVHGRASVDELDRVASALPYAVEGGFVFLPFTAEPTVRRWGTIVWNGSAERSRLVVHSHSARIGGEGCEIPIGAVEEPAFRVEQRGHHIYVDSLVEGSRAIFGGEWLVSRRFYGPRALIVFPAKGRTPSVLVMLESASDAPNFARYGQYWPTEGAGEEGNILLARAIAMQEPCGIVLTRGAVPAPDAEHVIREESAHTAVAIAADASVITSYAASIPGAVAEIANASDSPGELFRRARSRLG